MKKNNRFSKLIGIVLAAFFFIGALPLRELQADAQTHSEYNCSPLTVVYDQTSSWDNTTQGQFTVTNNSDEPINGWTFELSFSSDVALTNLWNAQDLSDENTSTNTLVIGNEVYNSSIPSGQAITFGMTVTGTEYAPVAPVSVSLVNDSQPDVTVTPTPAEEETHFPYVIYAGSTQTDLSINGWRSNITGDVYSGCNFVYQGSELYVVGTVRTVGTIQPSGWTTSMSGSQENAEPRQMPDWNDAIISKASTMTILDASAFSSQNDIIVNGYYRTDDSITINCASFSGTVFIVATGDITLNADLITGEGTVILYSETGNITINSTNATINGILHAPVGRVSLSGNDINVNGRIVADEFGYSGSTLNVTAAEEDLWFLQEDPEITPTAVPTITPFPTDEPTITPEPTPDPTSTPTVTPDPTEIVTATPTSTPTVTATPTEVVITVIPTATPDPTSTVTVTPTPVITSDPTPTVTDSPTPTPVDETSDSDEDGIPDYLEAELGTNPYDPDSDGDGLSDLIEVMTGYDPLIIDSDDNGVLDGDEDLDGDGLSNIEEISLGTGYLSEDSDSDGLSDGSEVYVYGTDPQNYDSDGDQISDGDEVTLGKNPNDPSDASVRILQTAEEEIDNAEDPSIMSVQVTLELANLISRSVRIKDMYNVDYYSTDVAGRVGSPFSLECEEDFSTSSVVISYDEAALGDTDEEDLGVLWYNEDSRFYIIQDQAVLDTEANTITLELDHFSTYVVVNTAAWYEAWEAAAVAFNDYFEDHPEDMSLSAQATDITIIVDESYYYMNSADKREAYAAIENIISNMRPQDSVAITYLQYNTYEIPQLGYRSDPEGKALWLQTAGDVLLGIQSDILFLDGGRQREPNLTRNAYNELRRGRNEENNVTIFISSGLKETLNNAGYYSGIGSIDYSLYSTRQVSQLPSLFQQDCLSKGGAIYDRYSNSFLSDNGLDANTSGPADLDGDGLYDFIEQAGLRFSTNGTLHVVHTNSSPDDEDGDGIADGYDTDHDTLSDGEEMGQMYRIENTIGANGSIEHTIIPSVNSEDWQSILDCIPDIQGVFYVFAAESDPTDEDTDGDEYLDYEDGIPFEINPDVVYIFYPEVGDPALTEEAMNRAFFYSCDVKRESIESVDDFKDSWNRMGTYEDKEVNEDEENGNTKYVYNIFEVVTVFHGNYNYIEVSNNNRFFAENITSELKCKRIKTLRLSSCHSGELYQIPDSLAYAFMEMGTIEEVFAWDGTAVYGSTFGYTQKIITIDNDSVSFSLVVDIKLIVEMEGSSFDAINNYVSFYCSGLVDRLFLHLVPINNIDNLFFCPQGLVRYYRNASGEIDYENVSDINLYTNCWLCI